MIVSLRLFWQGENDVWKNDPICVAGCNSAGLLAALGFARITGRQVRQIFSKRWNEIRESAVAGVVRLVWRGMSDDWFSWAVGAAIVVPLFVIFYKESAPQVAPFSWFADNWGDFLGSVVGGIVAFLLARYAFNREMKTRQLLEASKHAHLFGHAIGCIDKWRKDFIPSLKQGVATAYGFRVASQLPSSEDNSSPDMQTSRQKQIAMAKSALTDLDKVQQLIIGFGDVDKNALEKIDSFWRLQATLTEIGRQLRATRKESNLLRQELDTLVHGGQKAKANDRFEVIIGRAEWIESASLNARNSLEMIKRMKHLPDDLELMGAPPIEDEV